MDILSMFGFAENDEGDGGEDEDNAEEESRGEGLGDDTPHRIHYKKLKA